MSKTRASGTPLFVVDGGSGTSLPEGATCMRYARHQAVFEHGEDPEAYAFVVSGRVKLVCAQASGRETILDFVEPGQLICGNAVFVGVPYCCTAVAATSGTEVMTVPRTRLNEAVDGAAESVQLILQSVTRRGMTLCRRVAEVAGGKVQRKIAMVLLRLGEQVARSGPTEVMLPSTLTRQDIAELCGTSVETAIRLIKDLEREGRVRLEGRRIIIPSLAALRGWVERG